MHRLRSLSKQINKICKGGRTGEKSEKKKKKNAAQNDSTADVIDLRVEQDDLLLTQSTSLVQREELMMRDGLSEEAQADLQQDLENLWLQIRVEVRHSFSPNLRAARLRAAVACIQQQEHMDQRWLSLGPDQDPDRGPDQDPDRGPVLVPKWRPHRALMEHNELLGHMVRARLAKQDTSAEAVSENHGAEGDNGKEEEHGAEDNHGEAKDHGTEEEHGAENNHGEAKDHGTEEASEPVTDEVWRMAEQMQQDLLYIKNTLSPCYPPEMDILNLYAQLYHHCFSSRLQQLATTALDHSALYSLLEWANHRYPKELLSDPELEGQIDSVLLGPLFPPDVLDQLQDQHLTNTQSTMQKWLDKALQIEKQSWLRGTKADLHCYCYSPLATDIIEVIVSSLKKLNCVETEQSSQRVTAHLDGFFNRYLEAVEDFVKGDHTNTASVLKAQLACEEQFREFVLNQEMADQTRQRCLDSLSALKDSGYCSLTSGIRSQLKARMSGLWTQRWMDGSEPLIDSLLDHLHQQLQHLTDLKPSCRQWLLGQLHRDMALRYVKNLLKSRRRSQEEQMGGANRMKDDVIKMETFFTQQGSCGLERVTQILLHVAEILGLQDPDSVQLELVTLARLCPDLRATHVSRLLLLKRGLSGVSIRRIKHSVEENRPRAEPTNHSPAFFSKLKVKWFNPCAPLPMLLHSAS